MRDAVGTAAIAALATLAFSAAVASPAPAQAAQGAAAAHPAWGYGGGYGPDYVVPAAPAVWVWREVYDADGNPLGRERVNLLG